MLFSQDVLIRFGIRARDMVRTEERERDLLHLSILETSLHTNVTDIIKVSQGKIQSSLEHGKIPCIRLRMYFRPDESDVFELFPVIHLNSHFRKSITLLISQQCLTSWVVSKILCSILQFIVEALMGIDIFVFMVLLVEGG